MKRKYLSVFLLICTFLLFGACSQDSYELKEEEYYLNLAKSLDTAFPELTFEHGKELDNNTLYLMFTFFVTTQNLYHSGEDFKTGSIYQIPVDTIEKVLKEYLDVKTFDGKALNCKSISFNENTNQIVTETIGAFGGTRNAKLDSVEYLGNNKVKFTVTYQEDGSTKKTNEYQIKQKDNETSYTLIHIMNH